VRLGTGVSVDVDESVGDQLGDGVIVGEEVGRGVSVWDGEGLEVDVLEEINDGRGVIEGGSAAG
jgi:hypothetical protein